MEMRQDYPTISVIIPSLNGKVAPLIRTLKNQTWEPFEVEVVKGVKPNGRARNLGVSATLGEYLVFIDDDAIPAQPNLLEDLVKPLMEDEEIGVTGCARLLPENSPWFQRRVAFEIPRTVNQIPHTWLETNPPLEGYGHSEITTTCCAIRRSVFEEAGCFSDTLISGVDTDFFYRVRNLGYSFIMIPDLYVEHPAPEDLLSLFRKFHWYGIGYSQETQRRPQQKMGMRLHTPIHRLLFLLAATVWLIPNIFILYSLGYPHLKLGFRPLKAISTYAVAWGYVQGWQKYKFRE